MENGRTTDWSDIASEIEAARDITPYNPLLAWGTLMFPHLLAKIVIWPQGWRHGDDEQLDEAVTAYYAQLKDITSQPSLRRRP